MPPSKSNDPEGEEPLFPNLTSKVAKAPPKTSTPVPTTDTALPLTGHDPLATPTGPTNPGNKPHTEWIPVSVHTAKCDKCSKHNTSVIQRCTRCNFQLCKDCIDNVGDNIHMADIDTLDWTPVVQPRGARKSSGAKKPTSKTPVALMTNNRATKPALRASARNARERVFTQARIESTVPDDDDDTIIVEAPERSKHRYISDGEYDDLEHKKSKRRYPIDAEYVDGEDTDDDELVERNVRYKHEERRPRDPAEERMVERSSAWQKVEDSALDKSYGYGYGYGKGKDGAESGEFASYSVHRPLSRPHTPRMASASTPHPSQSGLRSEFDFNDAIAKAYEQRQNSKRYAEERRLNQERQEAWKKNPLIQKLLQEGKEEEAKEMIEAATKMLMQQRGMN